MPCQAKPCINCLGTFWNRSAIVRWSKRTPTHQHGSNSSRASNHGCRKKLPIRNPPNASRSSTRRATHFGASALVAAINLQSLPLQALPSHPFSWTIPSSPPPPLHLPLLHSGLVFPLVVILLVIFILSDCLSKATCQVFS